MEARAWFLVYLTVLLQMECGIAAATYSSRLIHRFSDEMKGFGVLRNGGEIVGGWPERRSSEYYRFLMKSDVEKQKMRLGPRNQFLFPSEGSTTINYGNDFGWLHYTWIDIGMPSVSFLVALDAGSDLLWVPCDCVHCASLLASSYNSLDKDLNEYYPARSSTSKSLSCSHQLCQMGQTCKNPKQPCPYTVNYSSEGTSSSGFLVEDILHLASASDGSSNIYVRAPVIIGCGREQTGGYMDGIAPDGLLGLGLGEVSVPSFLAKAGIALNSFSLCFGDDNSGRIFFGDQGVAGQQTTAFLPLDGKYVTYIIGVETCCIGSTCLDQARFNALVDSGASFTYLPGEAYRRVVEEFDRQVNAAKFSSDELPFTHCYKSSSQELLKIPSVMLKFASNNSFVVHDPVYSINSSEGIVVGFCLAIEQAGGDIATIGQNFMTGYRMVYDRENLKLGWWPSNCQEDLSAPNERMPMSNSSAPNTLPSIEQASNPHPHAVAPAIAGRAPSKSSAASVSVHSYWPCLLQVVPLLLLLFRRQ